MSTMPYLFNICPSAIQLKNSNKLKLIKDVQEREKRGWECVHPIKEVFVDLTNQFGHRKSEVAHTVGKQYRVAMKRK